MLWSASPVGKSLLEAAAILASIVRGPVADVVVRREFRSSLPCSFQPDLRLVSDLLRGSPLPLPRLLDVDENLLLDSGQLRLLLWFELQLGWDGGPR